MIIDSHCHAGEYLTHFPERFASEMMASIQQKPETITTDVPRLLTEMDTAGIDMAFLLAFDAYRTVGAKVPNEYVAELCRRHPERFIGFGSVDGRSPDAAEQVRYFATVLGLRGLKIAPAYLHLSPADPCWYPVYTVAQELGLPVLIHVGFTPSKEAARQFFTPAGMGKIAQDFPRLKFIMAHMAAPWVPQCIDLLAKHANLYADLSIFGWYQPIETVTKSLVSARQRGVLQRILWGTDQPWGPLAPFRQRMDRLARDASLFAGQEPLNAQEWTNIMGATAMSTLEQSSHPDQQQEDRYVVSQPVPTHVQSAF